MALPCRVYGFNLAQESPMTFAKSSNHNPKIIIYLKYRVIFARNKPQLIIIIRDYPLVNIQKTMENHHVSQVNQPSMAIFNSYFDITRGFFWCQPWASVAWGNVCDPDAERANDAYVEPGGAMVQPLVNEQFATVWKMVIEIVDLPMKNRDFPQLWQFIRG